MTTHTWCTQTTDGPSTSGSVLPRREKGLNICWWNIGQGRLNICIELFAQHFLWLEIFSRKFVSEEGWSENGGKARDEPGKKHWKGFLGGVTNNTGRLTCSALT